MLDFYVNKLGMTKKSEVRYSVYLDRDDRPALQEIAREEPDRIFNIYLEAAPGQFIELFTAHASQKEHTQWDQHKVYSHFALSVDDIFKTRDQLLAGRFTIFLRVRLRPTRCVFMIRMVTILK